MNPLDELNNLITEWLITLDDLQQKKKISDTLLDILIFAYVFGVENVNESTGENIQADKNKMEKSIYKRIGGKNFEERIAEYTDAEQFKVLAETETHRIFGEGQSDCADEIGGLYKTWHTQLDNRVREQHWYLEDKTVRQDEYFYTITGDGALHPGGFGIPELDINCRCYLTYSKRGGIRSED